MEKGLFGTAAVPRHGIFVYKREFLIKSSADRHF